jgi:polyvinyl alcohol dehydrogenase (cytochrome)
MRETGRRQAGGWNQNKIRERFMGTHRAIRLASRYLLLVGASIAFLRIIGFASAPAFAQQSGEVLYFVNCAQCHEQAKGEAHAPSRSALAAMTSEDILRALESGAMSTIAKDIPQADKISIAKFVSGKRADPKPEGASEIGLCQDAPHAPTPDGLQWNGWGNSITNSRFQSAAAAALTPETVKKLKLKWAFGFQGSVNASAQPTVVGGRIFIGGGDRKFHALDAKTGCLYWTVPADANIRTAISIGKPEGYPNPIAYFGDNVGNAYAVDTSTGALIWKLKPDNHQAARITGAPTFYSGVVYVPVSSVEEAVGSSRGYQCCTFRGSVVALDGISGQQIWKAYTIAEEPQPTGESNDGTRKFGPSGAAIWSAPTIDAKRQALYIGTGNNYSNPSTDTSDAVIAFDLKTGAMLWHQQATVNDKFMNSCFLPNRINCPEGNGPDYDFAQSPILVTLADGKRLLVIGQKSGFVHAMDPDQNGKIIWQVGVGEGGSLGGVVWGSAVDQEHVYVANSGIRHLPGFKLNPHAGGGLFSLELETGKIAWKVPPFECGERIQCSPALSAAVTAIPGVVFSGGVSGYLGAYSTTDGTLLWTVDTAIEYHAVNGVAARGGAIDAAGPVIVDGMLYVDSGYSPWGGLPGNVLLAFSVNDD